MGIIFEKDYESLSVEELESEKDELKNSIKNEKLWYKGSCDADDEAMHIENISALEEEIEYIDELIRENLE